LPTSLSLHIIISDRIREQLIVSIDSALTYHSNCNFGFGSSLHTYCISTLSDHTFKFPVSGPYAKFYWKGIRNTETEEILRYYFVKLKELALVKEKGVNLQCHSSALQTNQSPPLASDRPLASCTLGLKLAYPGKRLQGQSESAFGCQHARANHPGSERGLPYRYYREFTSYWQL